VALTVAIHVLPHHGAVEEYELVWSNPHNGTVLLMEFLDPKVVSTFEHCSHERDPACCCDLWARESPEGMEVDVVDCIETEV
jgi:hypothetical protein